MLATILLVLVGLVGVIVIAALIWFLIELLAVAVVQWRDVLSLDRWHEVMQTMSRNKLRTALTSISVAWGIFVLVVLLGLGNGLDQGLRRTFEREAQNRVWMSASKTSIAHGGFDVGRRLEFENVDYDRARTVEGIDRITGQHFVGGNRRGISHLTRRGSKASSFFINAVHADSYFLGGHVMVQGRFLNDADIAYKRKSVVIGNAVAKFLFAGDEDPIGDWINIGSVPFQVIGVFTDPQGAEEERQIYIPISTAQLAYSGADKLNSLQFTLGDADAGQSQRIIDDVVAQLAERHHFDPADKQAVRVHNSIEEFSRFQMLFWLIASFVTVIGLGTLAAGVVGVSNIMMIAVKERTKEIGVRKALGATPPSIIFMVLQEAVFLTGISGLAGLAGGVLGLQLLGKLETDYIYNPGIQIQHGLTATVGLIIAGALAGYFPARAAAKVNPIHALRDE